MRNEAAELRLRTAGVAKRFSLAACVESDLTLACADSRMRHQNFRIQELFSASLEACE